MPMDLLHLEMMVLSETSTLVELLGWMGDFDWGQLISLGVIRKGSISLTVMKRAMSSYSAADDMSNLMIWVIVTIVMSCRKQGP